MPKRSWGRVFGSRFTTKSAGKGPFEITNYTVTAGRTRHQSEHIYAIVDHDTQLAMIVVNSFPGRLITMLGA